MTDPTQNHGRLSRTALAAALALWLAAIIANIRWDLLLIENLLLREPALYVCVASALLLFLSAAPWDKRQRPPPVITVLLLATCANLWLFDREDRSPACFSPRPATFAGAGADPPLETHFTVLPLYLNIRDRLRPAQIISYAPIFETSYLKYLGEVGQLEIRHYDPRLREDQLNAASLEATLSIDDYATGLSWRIPPAAAPGGRYTVYRHAGVHYLLATRPGAGP